MALRSWLLIACGLLGACAGESSSTMSVYGAGAPVSAGGATSSGGVAMGGSVARTGGTPAAAGGQVSVIAVPGGGRDPQSTQCATSSDGCPVGAEYLSCLNTSCGKNLNSCYQVSATGTVLGGICAGYAKCQLQCPCDRTRGACESQCYLDFISADPGCATCMYTVYSCTAKNNCGSPVTCGSGGAGGTVSSVGGAGGSLAGTGAMGAGGSGPGGGGAVATGGRPTGGVVSPSVDAGLGPNCNEAVRCCRQISSVVSANLNLCNGISGTSESTCLQVLKDLRGVGLCPPVLD